MGGDMAKAPGDLMRAIREKADKTQEQMAAELGWTQPYIAKLESGRAFVRTEDLRRVAAAYGLRPEQLIPTTEAKAS